MVSKPAQQHDEEDAPRLGQPVSVCLTAVCDTAAELARVQEALGRVQVGLGLDGVYTHMGVWVMCDEDHHDG